MAKLQKRIRHQQHRSKQMRNSVTKLSPAEIRSLNYSVDASKTGTVPSSQTSSAIPSHRSSSNTPPLSPENVTTDPRPISQALNGNLPTPPQSPDAATEHRRNSNPTNGLEQIYAPKPHPYNAAQFVTRGPTSRPSSASSYRGMQTYRGPELTRNGSVTMLHQPPQEIVSNPLSQFSRPRRSQTSTSPDRRNSCHSVTSPAVQDSAEEQKPPSLSASSSSVRGSSPQRLPDSPVSSEVIESMGYPTIVRSRNSQEHAVVDSPVPVVEEERQGRSKSNRSSWIWKKNSNTNQQHPEDVDSAINRSNRRPTLSFQKRSSSTHSIPYADTKPGAAPIPKDTLKGELPSNKAGISKPQGENTVKATDDMFETHPSVRPLSLHIPDNTGTSPEEVHSDQMPTSPDIKGKGRQHDSVPVYGRCSCCGKLRKPNTFHSELSPVMENENLRTNFSFEADKASAFNKRRSSSAASSQRQKYMPIIPMQIDKHRTVQATIEPYNPATMNESSPVVNESGDLIASSAEPVPIQPKRLLDPSLVRFSSLHARKEDNKKAKEGKMADTNGTTTNRLPETSEMSSPPPLTNDAKENTEVDVNGLSSITSAEIKNLPTNDANDNPLQAQLDQQDQVFSKGQRPQRVEEHRMKFKDSTRQNLVSNANAIHEKVTTPSQIAVNSELDDTLYESSNRHTTASKIEGDSGLVNSKDKPNQIAMGNRTRWKHQSMPVQAVNEPSSQQHSPFSIFKRHRKSSSDSKTFVRATAVSSLPSPKPMDESKLGANGGLTLPMEPITAHHLVTTIPLTESENPIVILEQKKRNTAPASYIQMEPAKIRPFSEPTSINGNGLQGIMPLSSPSHAAAVQISEIQPQLASSSAQPTSASPPSGMSHFMTTSPSEEKPKDLETITEESAQSSVPASYPKSIDPQELQQSEPTARPTESTSILTATAPPSFLPTPHLGPRFARSSATLHNFVLENKSSSNLVEAVVAASESEGPNHSNHVSTETVSNITSDHTTPVLGMIENDPVSEMKFRQVLRKRRLMDEDRQRAQKLVEEVMSI